MNAAQQPNIEVPTVPAGIDGDWATWLDQLEEGVAVVRVAPYEYALAVVLDDGEWHRVSESFGVDDDDWMEAMPDFTPGGRRYAVGTVVLVDGDGGGRDALIPNAES